MQFKDTVRRLSRLYEIPEAQMSAFENRIKNIQRLGWPEGANTGRGVAADYSPKMLREMAFVTELTVLGVTPERAIQIVKANLPSLHRAAEVGGSIDLHSPPLFGERVPDGIVRLDFSRALNLTFAEAA
jgi:hypothetical protein